MNATMNEIDPALKHSRLVNTKGTIIKAFGMRLTSTGEQTTSRGYAATVFHNEAGKEVVITRAYQNRSDMTILEVTSV